MQELLNGVDATFIRYNTSTVPTQHTRNSYVPQCRSQRFTVNQFDDLREANTISNANRTSRAKFTNVHEPTTPVEAVNCSLWQEQTRWVQVRTSQTCCQTWHGAPCCWSSYLERP
jgi:GH25 family lysozyme M1 (1,4-beta-N-acetylmuramidase)